MNDKIFARREETGIPYYACRALESIQGIRHGFSTRRGGSGVLAENSLNLGQESQYSSDQVEVNRRRFLSALHIEHANLITLHQIHSDRFVIIGENPGEWNPLEGDALITQARGVALAIQVADCLPILLADPMTRCVAAIHAGWKGTLARIAGKTLAGMQREFGSNPENCLIVIGAGIRSCCFEVGREVARSFEEAFPGISCARSHPNHPGKYFLDMRAALDVQLFSAGIRRENILDLGLCTRCNPEEFFSYRGEGARAGRMMGVIALT
jgi:polyphenol oxidase